MELKARGNRWVVTNDDASGQLRRPEKCCVGQRSVGWFEEDDVFSYGTSMVYRAPHSWVDLDGLQRVKLATKSIVDATIQIVIRQPICESMDRGHQSKSKTDQSQCSSCSPAVSGNAVLSLLLHQADVEKTEMRKPTPMRYRKDIHQLMPVK
ncbi:hypothetical protein ACLOJK_020875 [Asimina triloba]